ncbi:uncharacterized protein LOC131648855 [Vicia villosa]|uniref:uncharacterized protein LOC131648855 n=1 Tax=Vicia villosa TaxID=3911 RepID=UPI00273A7DD6|nr:uncharacterized protein LOC131648855 [Vicia villosa]
MHPNFAAEPRNIRLGLCSDGFTPYVQQSGTGYSCWPVIVTPYNPPLEMCMTKPYMFLSCLIPGPSSSKAGIDVYLQPLIDDLKRLWIGECTYDISRKQNFNMRAALMWTINDFPAYAMLSGWGTHGKMGCPHCMDKTKAFTLDEGGKKKNFFEKVFNTVMDVQGKTKDNEKARKDMELYCNRKDLELKTLPNGKLLKPKATYSLTPQEAKLVCRWLTELRMPDGYASNLARCANANTGKLTGMKSHDCHVFMERFLPIAFSSLPTQVLNPLTEISQFFRDICASILRVDDLLQLDQDIPLILCKWMYPVERFMGDSKRLVKNKAKVEGSICAYYLHRETSHFCSHYFNHMMLIPRITRNEVNVPERSQFTLSIFGLPGRSSGKTNVQWMTEKELQSAHVHVLIICVEVKPYIELYNNFHYELTGEQATTTNIHAYFPSWFKQQLHTSFVNGYKFHSDEWTEGKKTINSGMFLKRVTDGGEDDFYGVITHIYELEYNYLDSENKVVLFYCDWQVYFVPYPSIQRAKHDWCVAIKSKPIGHIETDDLVEDLAYQVDEMSQNNHVTEVEQLTSLCDNEVEGQQVDASILLPSNNVDEDDEESESEDNFESNEDNEDFE